MKLSIAKFYTLYALPIFLLSGCAMPGTYLQHGIVEAGKSPTTYKNVVVTGSSELNPPIGIFLAEGGYDYVYSNEEIVSNTYLVKQGDVLSLNCTYLGQFKQDAFSTTAKITCNANDLATGEKIYSGVGEFMGTSRSDDLSGAVKAALISFPTKSGYGSNVNLFRLPVRKAGSAKTKINSTYNPTLSTYMPRSSTYQSYRGGGGCGSRGGPGWRKANGKCASWSD